MGEKSDAWKDGAYLIQLKPLSISEKEIKEQSDKFDQARDEFRNKMEFDLFTDEEHNVVWTSLIHYKLVTVRRNKLLFIKDYLTWRTHSSSVPEFKFCYSVGALLLYLRYLASPVSSPSFIFPYDVENRTVNVKVNSAIADKLSDLHAILGPWAHLIMGLKPVSKSLIGTPHISLAEEGDINLLESKYAELAAIMAQVYQLVRVSLATFLSEYVASAKLKTLSKISVDLGKL